MTSENDQEKEDKGSWGWLIAGILIGFIILFRAAPKSYPWDEPGYAPPGPEPQGQTYGSQQPRYEPGTYGDFWDRERAAERGAPGVKASPGMRPDPDYAGQASNEDALRAENARLRAENEKLRQQQR